MSDQIDPTVRTTLKRLPERGVFDRAEIDAILDEGLVCHVGFVHDGHPVVIPTTYARVGDDLIVHGSPASRMLRTLKGDVEVCVTVTLLDGLVLARSPFHHSMNYRSVVVFGRAQAITDPAERLAAVDAIVDHVVPGRLDSLRPHLDTELKGTLALRLPITEASAKVRTGPPIDDEPDYDLPIWAGELPVVTSFGPPIVDPNSKVDMDLPVHVRDYRRPSR